MAEAEEQVRDFLEETGEKKRSRERQESLPLFVSSSSLCSSSPLDPLLFFSVDQAEKQRDTELEAEGDLGAAAEAELKEKNAAAMYGESIHNVDLLPFSSSIFFFSIFLSFVFLY